MQTNSKLKPDTIAYIAEGWQIYKREPVLLSGVTLLMVICSAIAGSIPFASALVTPPLLAGIYVMVMRIERGDQVRFSNYFDGFRWWLPLVLASLVMSLFISLGILLLVLPGLYLALAYGFTSLNIIDAGQNFWPAMENSRKLITANFWQYLLLALLFLLICILGAIPFGLGLLVAVPVCLAAQYAFYRDLNSDLSSDGGTDQTQ